MQIPKGQGAARRHSVGTNTATIPKAGTRSREKAVVGGEWVEGACPEAEAGCGNESIQGDGLTVPPDRRAVGKQHDNGRETAIGREKPKAVSPRSARKRCGWRVAGGAGQAGIASAAV